MHNFTDHSSPYLSHTWLRPVPQFIYIFSLYLYPNFLLIGCPSKTEGLNSRCIAVCPMIILEIATLTDIIWSQEQ